MNSHSARATALIEHCRTLSHGSAQVATAEEAVRQADLSGDRDLRIAARYELVTAATFAGRAELSLAAFAWNISTYTLEELSADDVWFQFQWLAEDCAVMLAVKRADFDHILSEMARVYQLSNWASYPVNLARFRSAEVFGASRAELLETFDALEQSMEGYRRSAYLVHVLAAAHLSVGKFERGIELISANFTREVDEESEYPTRCHGIITLPLGQLGRVEQAEHHFRTACRMASTNPVYLRVIAPLICHAGMAGDTAMVVELLERHLPWAISNFDRWSAMRFYLCAAWALHRCDGREIGMRLPREFSGWRADGRYAGRALADELRAEGVRLAAAFDERHGNSVWTDRARALEEGNPVEFLYPH